MRLNLHLVFFVFLFVIYVVQSWELADEVVGSYDDAQTRFCGYCNCPSSYIPFCGTNNKTYKNVCNLRCAQRCIPSLRIDFEGICPSFYNNEVAPSHLTGSHYWYGDDLPQTKEELHVQKAKYTSGTSGQREFSNTIVSPGSGSSIPAKPFSSKGPSGSSQISASGSSGPGSSGAGQPGSGGGSSSSGSPSSVGFSQNNLATTPASYKPTGGSSSSSGGSNGGGGSGGKKDNGVSSTQVGYPTLPTKPPKKQPNPYKLTHNNKPSYKYCPCNRNGTFGAYCDPEIPTGSCQCKANYKGTYCDRCNDGFFGFPYCGRCDCFSRGSNSGSCARVDGACECRDNYEGETCNTCSEGYFSFPSCYKCNCDLRGTRPGTCNKVNGGCLCKEGYEGPRCDKCLPGYYGFPYCRPCACTGRAAGTRNLICNQVTGQCDCFPQYLGRTCDRCQYSFQRYPDCYPGYLKAKLP